MFSVILIKTVKYSDKQMDKELEGRANGSMVTVPTAELKKLQAKLAAAEKVMEQAESIVSMAVKTMRAAHVHRAEVYDMTEEFLKAIAEYKKGDKS